MNNAIELLYEIQKLMELKGENPFKSKAYEKAAQILAGQGDLVERAKTGTLTDLRGVGKGIAEVLTEFLLKGYSTARDELKNSLPHGLIELTQIPGLGPKKARVLIEELNIHSIGELEYACKENRLLHLKGFGPKIQLKILEGISFYHSTSGLLRLVDGVEGAESCLRFLRNELPDVRIHETGELRRKKEVLQKLEFLVELKEGQKTQSRAENALKAFLSEHKPGLPIELHFSSPEFFGYEWARTTGTSQHWEILGNPARVESQTEEEFYRNLGLPWIPPEARETGEEVSFAKSGSLKDLLPWEGLRGVFHNHTVRSDGTATLEEMVQEAERLGFEYIGISDHSQSAFYAQGLKEDMLREQEKEIRFVQEKHPKIRIFWGIESDILADGSLDYDSDVLKRFDFVIASIHSRFNMDREQMTARILKAVQNPFTRFLGHPTGRLLLGRKAYDVDMEAVIAEASKQNVAIEMNANPARLDLDWRWGVEMRKNNTLTSINPDAHSIEGLSDVRFGIAMARKALISRSQVINSRSVQEVETWLKRN